jgi:hypothetical protein
MALEARVKKLEEALRPAGTLVVVPRYPCETDAQARAKAGDVSDHDLVVILLRWTECPEGRHTHQDEVKRWRAL